MAKTEQAASYTPGAMRAAKAIKDEIFRTDCYHVPEAAAIISRETLDRELLEALEAASDLLHDDPNDERDPELNRVCKLVRTAIAKAKGAK